MHIDTRFHTQAASNGQTVAANLLAACQSGAAIFYPEDAVIYAQGDKADHLNVVEFGVVRICRLTSDGRRQISAFLFAGDVFGFEVGGEHEFYAESVNGAGVRSLRINDALAPNLLAVALGSLIQAQYHQLVLGRCSATEKVAGFILDMTDKLGDDDTIGLPMQRNDIADYLGLTFETVSRALRVLKDGGAIQVPAVHQIRIIDPVLLRTFAG